MLFEGVAVAAKDAVLREESIHLSYETDSLVQICSDDVESFFRAPVNWLFTVMIQRRTESTRQWCDVICHRAGRDERLPTGDRRLPGQAMKARLPCLEH